MYVEKNTLPFEHNDLYRSIQYMLQGVMDAGDKLIMIPDDNRDPSSRTLPTPVPLGVWAWNEDASAPKYVTPDDLYDGSLVAADIQDVRDSKADRVALEQLRATLPLNLSDFPNLADAVAAASGKTLLIDTDLNVEADITIPSDVVLEQAGGTLIVQPGVTMNIAGTYRSNGRQLIHRADYTAKIIGLFAADESVKGAPDVPGQRRVEFNPRYAVTTVFPTTAASTFTTGHQRIVREHGDLFISVKYTGALAQIIVQLTDGSAVLAQSTENFSGSPGGTFQPWRTQVFEGDGISKEVILRAPGLSMADVPNASHFRILFNDSTAFRVANFVLQDIKYGYINDNHVRYTDSKTKFFKAYSIREGYPTSLWYNAPDLSYFRRAADHAKRLGASAVRITMPYKSLVDASGNYVRTQAAKFDAALAYVGSLGMAAIVSINHCFGADSHPQDIVYPEHIDNPAVLPDLFMRAERAAMYFEQHPTVVQIELQNEMNLYWVNSIRGTPAYWASAWAYFSGLAQAVRAVSTKMISISTSSGDAARNCIGLGQALGVDFMDCHVYDGQQLKDLWPNFDTISLEQDSRTLLNRAQQVCQGYGPWTAYVTATHNSYNADFEQAYIEARRGDNLLRIEPKSDVYVDNTFALARVPSNVNVVYNSVRTAGGYIGWTRVAGGWKGFGQIEA